MTENSSLVWTAVFRKFWWLKLRIYEKRDTYSWSAKWALQAYYKRSFICCRYPEANGHFLEQMPLVSGLFGFAKVISFERVLLESWIFGRQWGRVRQIYGQNLTEIGRRRRLLFYKYTPNSNGTTAMQFTHIYIEHKILFLAEYFWFFPKADKWMKIDETG